MAFSMTVRRRLLPLVVTSLMVGTLVLVTSSPAYAVEFCNAAQITGYPGGPTDPGIHPSTPYPSQIVVSALTGTITDVNVTLRDWTTFGDSGGFHWPDDMDIMLVSPTGASTMLVSDAGGDENDGDLDLVSVDLILDDQAVNPLPADSQIVSGTFRPVDDDNDPNELDPVDVFPGGPAAPSTASLNTFNGLAPNGTWSLYVVDDTTLGHSNFTTGWCVDILTGGGGATPLPATKRVPDFDGDGDTDRSVFRNGAWYAEGQTTGFLGQAGDLPVPGQYDADPATERAVYRNGTWFIDGQANLFLGLAGDIPVPGDYDGDGNTDPAVYRPSVGGWYVDGQAPVFFGLSSDIPVPGDFDGDGDFDRAVYRPEFGGWYVDGQAPVFLGLSSDIPVPGQYDADPAFERAVWRPQFGGWYVEGATTSFLGLSGDVPVPGDYDASGDTERGIWRPSVGGWYVEGLSTVFLGLSSDIPLPLPYAVYDRFF